MRRPEGWDGWVGNVFSSQEGAYSKTALGLLLLHILLAASPGALSTPAANPEPTAEPELAAEPAAWPQPAAKPKPTVSSKPWQILHSLGCMDPGIPF